MKIRNFLLRMRGTDFCADGNFECFQPGDIIKIGFSKNHHDPTKFLSLSPLLVGFRNCDHSKRYLEGWFTRKIVVARNFGLRMRRTKFAKNGHFGNLGVSLRSLNHLKLILMSLSRKKTKITYLTMSVGLAQKGPCSGAIFVMALTYF